MPCFVCACSAGEPEVQTDSAQIKTNEPSSSAESVESNISSMQSPKSSAFISAAEISPLPKASKNVRRRQRQTPTTGKPTVLTASPYKQYLQESLSKQKTHVAAPKRRGAAGQSSSKPKESKKSMDREVNSLATENRPVKKKTAVKRKTVTRKKMAVQHDTTLCSFCGIQFGDKNKKATEDWIQCCQCSAWFHETCGEDCGLMDDDIFYCKNCID